VAEFEVIQEFFLGEVMPGHVSIGPGDDCAVFSVPTGFELCVSTDTLLEGVHFPLQAEPAVVASRSVAANLSDLAAMGAAPHAMTVALTVPNNNSSWLKVFSDECKRLASLHKAPIIGGNLAKGPLSVTLTVMGIVPSGKALTRSGAQVGDNIYVSGELGAAAGAVVQLASVPSIELLEEYNAPVPRLLLGQRLLDLANSAIDLSDGLLADLSHILEMSGKGAEINIAAVPIAPALLSDFDHAQSLELALNGGDDYELCFTANPNHHDSVVGIAHDEALKITKLGTVTETSGALTDSDGNLLLSRGYEHFK
jgi:thiamine-monophosphate kinase